MKTCTTCKKEKALDDFFRDNRRPEGRMARCKSCKGKAHREYVKATGYDRKRYWKDPAKERERHLVKKYGITEADYKRMFAAQKGKCAVCGKTQERAFDVDHCHNSGVVRGLLCTSCNRMIGHAGDDASRLVRGAAYLFTHHPQAAAEAIAIARDTLIDSGIWAALCREYAA